MGILFLEIYSMFLITFSFKKSVLWAPQKIPFTSFVFKWRQKSSDIWLNQTKQEKQPFKESSRCETEKAASTCQFSFSHCYIIIKISVRLSAEVKTQPDENTWIWGRFLHKAQLLENILKKGLWFFHPEMLEAVSLWSVSQFLLDCST